MEVREEREVFYKVTIPIYDRWWFDRHTKMKGVWKARIPQKIKIFLWMAWKDKLQTAE